MKKIALISINKSPNREELKQVHRLMSSQTARVEKIPSPGELFTPVTCCGTSQVFLCLRSSENIAPKIDTIDGHDAIVYAEYLHTIAQSV